MNRGDLQLFMTILEENNLIKAAELLYLSPSTAGARLRAMEDELGFELFERKRGVKTALPTPKGQDFARLASQMLALWNEADQITRSQEKPALSIATVDSFLDHNLSPLYRELVSDHGFSLDIKCYPADMIYALVAKKQADLGFALYHTNDPHVNVRPVMEDDMVLVTPESCPWISPVDPTGLSPERELFTGSHFNSNVGWGPEFRLWHDRYIGASRRPLVTASSISILTGFLEIGDYWTVMPSTTARGLAEQFPVKILELDPAPPKRTLYMLTHKSPSELSAANTERFCGYLWEYLEDRRKKTAKAQLSDG